MNIHPVTLNVPQERIDDLRVRLHAARLPPVAASSMLRAPDQARERSVDDIAREAHRGLA